MKEIRADLLANQYASEFMNNHHYVVDEAEKIMSNSTDPLYGWSHILDTVENTLEILIARNVSDQDVFNVCLTSAYWHEVGRIGNNKYAGISGNHEIVGVRMLDEFLQVTEKWEKRYIDMCTDAVKCHRYVLLPNKIAVKILADANRLGYIGIRRWEDCINANELSELSQDAESLDNTRDIYLTLPESKRLGNTNREALIKAFPMVKDILEGV